MLGSSSKGKRGRPRASAMPESSSPIPSGYASCGHSGCGETCHVRYAGPVSHIRDHHSWHAARGVTHVWTASIVTGFAIVLTGVLAYSAVEARPATRAINPATQNATQADVARLMDRLATIERKLQDVENACRTNASDQEEQQENQTDTTTE